MLFTPQAFVDLDLSLTGGYDSVIDRQNRYKSKEKYFGDESLGEDRFRLPADRLFGFFQAMSSRNCRDRKGLQGEGVERIDEWNYSTRPSCGFPCDTHDQLQFLGGPLLAGRKQNEGYVYYV